MRLKTPLLLSCVLASYAPTAAQARSLCVPAKAVLADCDHTAVDATSLAVLPDGETICLVAVGKKDVRTFGMMEDGRRRIMGGRRRWLHDSWTCGMTSSPSSLSSNALLHATRAALAVERRHSGPSRHRAATPSFSAAEALVCSLRGGACDDDDDEDDGDDDNLDELDDDEFGDSSELSESDFSSGDTPIAWVKRFWDSTPPLTQVYMGAVIAFTVGAAVLNGNQWPKLFELQWRPTIMRLQLWRPFTAFFYFGKVDIYLPLTLQVRRGVYSRTRSTVWRIEFGVRKGGEGRAPLLFPSPLSLPSSLRIAPHDVHDARCLLLLAVLRPVVSKLCAARPCLAVTGVAHPSSLSLRHRLPPPSTALLLMSSSRARGRPRSLSIRTWRSSSGWSTRRQRSL